MDNFSLFIPLAKVDAAKRLVYGTMAVEQPDRSGEIMDYATAKVAIQKWSDGFKDSTGGASLGNVREMHGKVAAGKLVEISFDDELKKVDVCAYVDDDSSWSKVQKRILNGFSIGGGYAKRWTDDGNRALKRYTPSLTELSLVDMPCIPGATFELIKADGTTETVEWGERGFEPANEDVKTKALSLAKAAGKPDRQNDFVVQARADLIKAHADAQAAVPELNDLEKAMAEADVLTKADAKKPYGDVEYADPKDGKYPIDTPAHIRAAWSYVNMAKNAAKLSDADAVKAKIVSAWKAKIDKDGPPSAEKAVFIGDLIKSGEAETMLKGMHEIALEKGFYTVGSTARLLNQMSDIASSVVWEERYEEDGDSKLPQGIMDLMASTKSFLIDMVNEETAEFFACCERDGGDVIALLAPVMEMASKTGELQKLHAADVPLMEKIGAKISGSNMKHVQSMHDHSMAMGAKCDSGNCDKAAGGDLAKVADLEEEMGRARRAMGGAASSIRTLAKTVGDQKDAMTKMAEEHTAALTELNAKLEKLGAGPGLAKGKLYSVSKAEDDLNLDPSRKAPGQAVSPEPVDFYERHARAMEKIGLTFAAPGGGHLY